MTNKGEGVSEMTPPTEQELNYWEELLKSMLSDSPDHIPLRLIAEVRRLRKVLHDIRGASACYENGTLIANAHPAYRIADDALVEFTSTIQMRTVGEGPRND